MSADQPLTLVLQPDETMPNSTLPVLIYRGVLADDATNKAGGFDALFEANGWTGIWRDGVYDYNHYHSNAHEVLGVAKGSAELQLGGDGGKSVKVEAGDVVVLPAGTGHRRISKSENFVVIGAYPAGQQHYDICRNRSPEAELRIIKTKLPDTDPVHGKQGPLLELWS
jgi:uncharacterized protein YjlB